MFVEAPGLGTLLRELLARLDGDVQQLYDAAEIEFRPRFHPIARALSDGGALGAVALAERARVSQPAVTQTLNEMRRLGLVEHVTSGDRRGRAVMLSAQGRAALRQLEPLWSAVRRAADTLDAETPGLRAALEGGLAALDQRAFADRVREEMR